VACDCEWGPPADNKCLPLFIHSEVGFAGTTTGLF
jgi:hypothetical protein